MPFQQSVLSVTNASVYCTFPTSFQYVVVCRKSEALKLLVLKKILLAWRAGSAVQHTCSYEGQESGSQHLCGSSQLALTPFAGNIQHLLLTSVGTRHSCGVHAYKLNFKKVTKKHLLDFFFGLFVFVLLRQGFSV